MPGEWLERVEERPGRWSVVKENAVRQLAVAAIEPRVRRDRDEAVKALGWSPTLASIIVSPLILAARSLAIATIVGSASFATDRRRVPVVGAATASASGSDEISFRH